MYIPLSSIDLILSALVAFVIAAITSTAGISGAFLLLPYQVSILGIVGPAASSTNLIYNVIAIPGGVYRYIRECRMDWQLAGIITAGTLPGVLAGTIIRIIYLPDPVRFKFFVGLVLLVIGIPLFFRNHHHHAHKLHHRPDFHMSPGIVTDARFTIARYEFTFDEEHYGLRPVTLFLMALAIGVIGGAYGVGGGAIISPVCIVVFGLPIYTVAGAALFGTFVTSIAGVVFYYLIAFRFETAALLITPDWMLGFMFGVGGFAGTYCGARMQKHLPERSIKTVLGILITALGLQYVAQFFLR
jgi:uncharacterized membrane protein YfcA